MHYLKCNHCGHFNEVKTKYLVFCESCSKKLDNTFNEWANRNPDKSFEDYKQLICTTEKTDLSKELHKTKNIKGLKYWIGFAVAFSVFSVIGQIGGEKLAGLFRKPAFDKALMETASEINKSCPIMIDNATRLDNAVALPNDVFQYNYTLVSMTKDSVNIDELKAYLEPAITNFVKTNPDMQTMRDNKVTVNYYYKDREGVYLFTISVKPEQYE